MARDASSTVQLRSGWVLIACLAACGNGPEVAAPIPPPAAEAGAQPPAEDAGPSVPAVAPSSEPDVDASSVVSAPTPESTAAPSTKTFEQATATPERLDPSDGRVQLDDGQLTGPMRGVLSQCRVPPNAKVTIKTAVQNGRAIGVSVYVEMPKRKPSPPSRKRPSKAATKAAAAAAKAAADAVARLKTCADHAVRLVVWPPSPRRDAFTTTF